MPSFVPVVPPARSDHLACSRCKHHDPDVTGYAAYALWSSVRGFLSSRTPSTQRLMEGQQKQLAETVQRCYRHCTEWAVQELPSTAPATATACTHVRRSVSICARAATATAAGPILIGQLFGRLLLQVHASPSNAVCPLLAGPCGVLPATQMFSHTPKGHRQQLSQQRIATAMAERCSHSSLWLEAGGYVLEALCDHGLASAGAAQTALPSSPRHAATVFLRPLEGHFSLTTLATPPRGWRLAGLDHGHVRRKLVGLLCSRTFHQRCGHLPRRSWHLSKSLLPVKRMLLQCDLTGTEQIWLPSWTPREWREVPVSRESTSRRKPWSSHRPCDFGVPLISLCAKRVFCSACLQNRSKPGQKKSQYGAVMRWIRGVGCKHQQCLRRIIVKTPLNLATYQVGDLWHFVSKRKSNQDAGTTAFRAVTSHSEACVQPALPAQTLTLLVCDLRDALMTVWSGARRLTDWTDP
ncbi:unnamed protein product [Polarella glacialis]|uniref:Uncharacterized protein n=1 Tax=Polarella glacialis TaxID=89957 RepID=A0A813HBC1_POLGL|nr:unnamed protein product [Polarella glacialis]